MRHAAFLWLASAARAGRLLGKVAAKPSTLNPNPQHPNPQPQTVNPKPYTVNPKVAAHGAARRRRRDLASALERWYGGARQRRAWRPVKVRAPVLKMHENSYT